MGVRADPRGVDRVTRQFGDFCAVTGRHLALVRASTGYRGRHLRLRELPCRRGLAAGRPAFSDHGGVARDVCRARDFLPVYDVTALNGLAAPVAVGRGGRAERRPGCAFRTPDAVTEHLDNPAVRGWDQLLCRHVDAPGSSGRAVQRPWVRPGARRRNVVSDAGAGRV